MNKLFIVTIQQKTVSFNIFDSIEYYVLTFLLPLARWATAKQLVIFEQVCSEKPIRIRLFCS